MLQPSFLHSDICRCCIASSCAFGADSVKLCATATSIGMSNPPIGLAALNELDDWLHAPSVSKRTAAAENGRLPIRRVIELDSPVKLPENSWYHRQSQYDSDVAGAANKGYQRRQSQLTTGRR